jgi:hypothetical protein
VDDGGLIRASINGTHDKRQAQQIISEINVLIAEREKKAKILIDMTNTGRPTYEARKIHAINLKIQANHFNKAALYGASAMNRVLANFIIKASGRGDKIRFFNTHSEAIKWLNGK